MIRHRAVTKAEKYTRSATKRKIVDERFMVERQAASAAGLASAGIAY